jgi:hypothetical protein
VWNKSSESVFVIQSKSYIEGRSDGIRPREPNAQHFTGSLAANKADIAS